MCIKLSCKTYNVINKINDKLIKLKKENDIVMAYMNIFFVARNDI